MGRVAGPRQSWNSLGLPLVFCAHPARAARRYGERGRRLYAGLASWLLGACIANEPELRNRLIAWTASSNRWMQRASAVALLHSAKAGKYPETVFAVAEKLLPVRDDMVEKGVGWLLKEAYPRLPRAVMAFLTAHRAAATRPTLRYAAEKMTAADKKLLLTPAPGT